MEKFSWSGEIQADVVDSHRVAMKKIAAELNRLLANVTFGGNIERWAFIPIILKDDFAAQYAEIVKKSSRGKVLEFRLKIPHSEFLTARPSAQIGLIFQALSRSITLMDTLGVSAEVQKQLRELLSQAEGNLGILN